MRDWNELKRLAEESKSKGEWYDAKSIDVFPEFHVDQDFMLACTPDAILALIAENERLEITKKALLAERKAQMDQLEPLRAEVETLRTLLTEAAEDIADWGAYASEYFQQKHDLAGCVARYREALGKGGHQDG